MVETNDRSLDYFAVVDEAIAPEENDTKIIKSVNQNGLNYVRFESYVQSFGRRNRNKRLWMGKVLKEMIQAEHVVEELNRGTLAGENGHPVPATGNVSLSRIVTIDPNNIAHRFLSFKWNADDTLLSAVVETLDDGVGGPGYKFMRHILQGLQPAFSLRSVVPQRKNPDGTIDVVGAGRFVTYDRVIGPSHKEAYINNDIPIKNVQTLPDLNTVLEGFTMDMIEHSEKIKRIIDHMEPIMESATVDVENATMSIKTGSGDRLIIAPEMKFRHAIADLFQ